MCVCVCVEREICRSQCVNADEWVKWMNATLSEVNLLEKKTMSLSVKNTRMQAMGSDYAVKSIRSIRENEFLSHVSPPFAGVWFVFPS